LTSVLGTLLGYAVAALWLAAPILGLLAVMRTRWFQRRRRIRWAGERIAPMSLRDPMDELGPLGEDPRDRRRRGYN